MRGKTWRVILDAAHPGALNMALDDAVMTCHAAGGLPPTLRFYGWRPACMSLGYFQRAASEVDLAACAAAGVDVVRRPTGGRAVLHDDEVTYSIVISQDYLAGSVLETYHTLSQGILAGLAYLGIQGEQATPRRGRGRTPQSADGMHAACFDAPSWYETVVAGRKIVGSAQTRHDGVILQHGSLLVGFDPVRLAGLLCVRDEGRREALAETLQARVTSVSEQMGRRPAPGEVERALTCGMAKALGLSLFFAGYTREEIDLARQLLHSKYTQQEWTMRR